MHKHNVEMEVALMPSKTLIFSSLLFTALTLGPAMAHLLELPNKMSLSREDYLTVQQIYRGWSLLGFIVWGALISTFVLTIRLWNHPGAFMWALIAFLCIAGTQIVFWTFTFPANQATDNWTVLPEHWEKLRRQWEYSHAAGAGLDLIALIALIILVIA